MSIDRDAVLAAHPLRHLWKPAPPEPPAWLQAARMVWHSDSTVLEDSEHLEDEAFNAAWLRIFKSSWPEPTEGSSDGGPTPIATFDAGDRVYSLFPEGRAVIVYASRAMAILTTDVAPDPMVDPQPLKETTP